MSSARIHGYRHYYGKLKNQDSGLAPSDDLINFLELELELAGVLISVHQRGSCIRAINKKDVYADRYGSEAGE